MVQQHLAWWGSRDNGMYQRRQASAFGFDEIREWQCLPGRSIDAVREVAMIQTADKNQTFS